MIRHFVKIFYGNFMDTLEREVNEYLSKSDFSTVAEIQDIKISPPRTRWSCHYGTLQGSLGG